MTTTPPPMLNSISDMQGYLDAVREMKSGCASVQPAHLRQWMERITALENTRG